MLNSPVRNTRGEPTEKALSPAELCNYHNKNLKVKGVAMVQAGRRNVEAARLHQMISGPASVTGLPSE